MVFIVHARNIIGPAICNTNNVSKKNSPLRLSEFFPKQLGIFNRNLTRLLHVHIYAKLQNFAQFPPTLTKLSCCIKHDHPVNFHI